MTSTNSEHTLLSLTKLAVSKTVDSRNSLGAVASLTAVHPVQLNAVPLVVAVQGGLHVLGPPGAGEGRGEVPAHAGLAQKQLVQRAARVISGAVQALGLRLLKPEVQEMESQSHIA